MKKIGKKIDFRWEVFIPAFAIVGGSAVIAVVNQEWLVKYSNKFFNWSLQTFGWLYQWTTMAVVIVIAILMFSKIGDIRLGGKNAKPKFSFASWFAMALTGGVATGIVTWGVNEPIVYFGNVYGELDKLGIKAGSDEAIRFALGRTFYNWTFVPYALYALTGLLVAYLYYNRKEKLNVANTLKPLLGEKIVSKKAFAGTIDTLSMLALAIGLITGITMCITLVISGLKGAYGVEESMGLYIGLGAFIVACFIFSTSVGMDKGLRVLGSVNAGFYYGLLLLLFIAGPTLFILRSGTAGLAEWGDNFFSWGLDPIDIGGEALVQWWTFFDWAFWIGYAPVTGIFLAMIAYGRTVREFLIVNWILPSIFGIVWFSVWGGSAIEMQMSGVADLVGAINEGGATQALWMFLQNLPYGLGKIVIPVNILIILVSFITAADATLTNIGSMCVKDVPIGTEPPVRLKVIWGVAAGVTAIVMSIYGGGSQGVDGVKALASVAGFVVLFVFVLQVLTFIKLFFTEKLVGYTGKDRIVEGVEEDFGKPEEM